MNEKERFDQEDLALLNRWLAGEHALEYELWVKRGLLEHLVSYLGKVLFRFFPMSKSLPVDSHGSLHQEDYLQIFTIEVSDIANEIFCLFKKNPGRYNFPGWGQFFEYVKKSAKGLCLNEWGRFQGGEGMEIKSLEDAICDDHQGGEPLRLEDVVASSPEENPLELLLHQETLHDSLRRALEPVTEFYTSFKEETLKRKPSLRKHLIFLEGLVSRFVENEELVVLVIILCLWLGWRYFSLCVKITKEARHLSEFNRNRYQSYNRRLAAALKEELEKAPHARELILRALEVAKG